MTQFIENLRESLEDAPISDAAKDIILKITKYFDGTENEPSDFQRWRLLDWLSEEDGRDVFDIAGVKAATEAFNFIYRTDQFGLQITKDDADERFMRETYYGGLRIFIEYNAYADSVRLESGLLGVYAKITVTNGCHCITLEDVQFTVESGGKVRAKRSIIDKIDREDARKFNLTRRDLDKLIRTELVDAIQYSVDAVRKILLLAY